MRQTRYIYERPGWPGLHWREAEVGGWLAEVRHRQGRFIGGMEARGFRLRSEATLCTLTEDVVKSSEIEGEKLDTEQVRSSIARRLGIDIGALTPADRAVEGVVEMVLDATQGYERPLTKQRLFDWHSALFPTPRRGVARIVVGAWRDDVAGPMQVVSVAVGRERVHYQAPPASRVDAEMTTFLEWLDAGGSIDPVAKAALAHLWFVTVHPFDDGNGRIARAIADMMLARSEASEQRFYSMSAQIRAERNDYYDVLVSTQKGDLDVTPWMSWFLGCLDRALRGAESTLAVVLEKARFWELHGATPMNPRQREMINRLLDGLDATITSSRWAALSRCSQDTALRDIDDLVGRNVLVRSPARGRSTSYALSRAGQPPHS